MQLTRSKLLRQLALGLSLGFLVAACGVNRSQSSLPTISAGEPVKPLRVGTAPPFPPFEMRNEQGQLIGFDVDLINAISEHIGQEVAIETFSFDDLTLALQEERLDIAISAIPMTRERSQTVDFSHPYIDAGLVIVVRQRQEAIESEADLTGKTLAVQIDTEGARRAVKILGSRILAFGTAEEAVKALAAGKADAVIHDKPVVLHAIASQNLTTLRLIDRPLTYQVYSIALPKGSALTANINEALETLVENGTYAQLYEKWFGSMP